MRWGHLNIFLIFVLALLWLQIDSVSVFSFPKVITATPMPTATPTPTQAPPQTLIVPKLELNSLIEPVSVDDTGKMDVPSGTGSVGWYTKAAKPGEQGTAVLDGHLDDTTGQPAVFYNLKSLVVGDQIYVVDQLGNRLSFTVYEITQYPIETVVEDIYKKDNNKNLALITCAGWWNTSLQSYSHRLVVYAKM